MSLSQNFNSEYPAKKDNDNVLSIRYTIGGGNAVILAFDFQARVMLSRTGSSDGGLNVVPFSQLDRETLVSMRDKLVELGGKPPELPPEAPATQSPTRKFNL